jgi:purine-binding chemotaxis protein CheW
MPERGNTPETCIIVVEADGKSVGLPVDTVKEVMNIREEQIEEPPHFGAVADSAFVRGLGKVGDRVKILLDIDRVLGDLEATGVPA